MNITREDFESRTRHLLEKSKAICEIVMQEANMDWTQIYNERNLIVSYGGYKGIPRILLINKAGQVIYENTNYDRADEDLIMLHAFLKGE